jgi:Arm DNA-binding domain
LGAFPQVSLAEARAARDTARAKIRDGIDPIIARQTPVITSAPVLTFDECAAAYFKSHATAWRNAKHRRQWLRRWRPMSHPSLALCRSTRSILAL